MAKAEKHGTFALLTGNEVFDRMVEQAFGGLKFWEGYFLGRARRAREEGNRAKEFEFETAAANARLLAVAVDRAADEENGHG